MNAIKDLAPNGEHINCVRHIWANWKNKGFKGEKVKSLFWDMVKCPNEEQLKGKLEAIRLKSNEAYQDLMNRGPKSFCRAYIQTWCKSDMINNNICETFNSYIRKGRDKSLIDMLEYIRENLMERMEK